MDANEIKNFLFQSTHPRGVRLKVLPKAITMSNFNPRTHVGCDTFAMVNAFRFFDFNPRTHVGCDY